MDNMYTGEIGHMVFVCVTSAELDELCVLTTIEYDVRILPANVFKPLGSDGFRSQWADADCMCVFHTRIQTFWLETKKSFLNKLGSGSLSDATHQISWLVVSDKKV